MTDSSLPPQAPGLTLTDRLVFLRAIIGQDVVVQLKVSRLDAANYNIHVLKAGRANDMEVDEPDVDVPTDIIIKAAWAEYLRGEGFNVSKTNSLRDNGVG